MDPLIRQRLVGTLVLLALGVVFWPIIFIEPVSDEPIERMVMPPRPAVDESPLPEPVVPSAEALGGLQAPVLDAVEQETADANTTLAADEGETDLAVELPEAASLDPAVPRDKAPPAPKLDAQGFAEAWVLQVATVSTRSRADTLVTSLQSKGYEAFRRDFQSNGKTLWRVQIGPRIERDKLKAIKTEVDRALKVDATILRYVP